MSFLVNSYILSGSAAVPIILFSSTQSENLIQVVFDQDMDKFNTTGWSFKKNGSNLAIQQVTGYGDTWLFRVSAMLNSDTILLSYNSGTGNAQSTSSIALGSYADSAVTNTFTPQAPEFIMTIKTDVPGAVDPNKFVYPLYIDGSASANGVIDWGDGNTTNVPAIIFPLPNHTYASPGTYTVKFTGPNTGINLASAFSNYGADVKQVQTIEQWGSDTVWETWRRAFWKGNAITINATDSPNLTAVTSLESAFQQINLSGTLKNIYAPLATNCSYMFYGATTGNPNLPYWFLPSCTTLEGAFADSPFYEGDGLESWLITNALTSLAETWSNCLLFNGITNYFDVSGVTTFYRTFYHCEVHNQAIPKWVTSSAVNMRDTFAYNSLFDQEINHFIMDNVTTLYGFLYRCLVFNKPMNNLNIGNVTTIRSCWERCLLFNQDVSMLDFSSVTNADYAFFECDNFNCGGGNLGLIDTSSFTTMEGMFYLNLALNQNLGTWNISNVTNSTADFMNMGAGPWAMTPANLDALYNGWAVQTRNAGVTIGFGLLNYTSAGAASRATIAATPWTITDGGII